MAPEIDWPSRPPSLSGTERSSRRPSAKACAVRPPSSQQVGRHRSTTAPARGRPTPCRAAAPTARARHRDRPSSPPGVVSTCCTQAMSTCCGPHVHSVTGSSCASTPTCPCAASRVGAGRSCPKPTVLVCCWRWSASTTWSSSTRTPRWSCCADSARTSGPRAVTMPARSCRSWMCSRSGAARRSCCRTSRVARRPPSSRP